MPVDQLITLLSNIFCLSVCLVRWSLICNKHMYVFVILGIFNKSSANVSKHVFFLVKKYYLKWPKFEFNWLDRTRDNLQSYLGSH